MLIQYCSNVQADDFGIFVNSISLPCLPFVDSKLWHSRCANNRIKIYLKQQFYFDSFKLLFSYFFGDSQISRSHYSRVDSQSYAKMRQMDTPAMEKSARMYKYDDNCTQNVNCQFCGRKFCFQYRYRIQSATMKPKIYLPKWPFSIQLSTF